MLDFFVRPFIDDQQLRLAFFASVLVSITCAVAGTFVVLRGLAFMAFTAFFTTIVLVTIRTNDK